MYDNVIDNIERGHQKQLKTSLNYARLLPLFARKSLLYIA